MRIQTRLIAMAVVGFLLALIIGAMLLNAAFKQNRAFDDANLAEDIYSNLWQLRARNSEYEIRRDTDSRADWTNTFVETRTKLRILQKQCPELTARLDTVQGILTDTGTLFERHVAEHSRPEAPNPTIERRLNAEITDHITSMIGHMAQIAESFDAAVLNAGAESKAQAAAGILLLLLFMVGFSLYTGRQLVHRLQELQRDAMVIGEGELSHRVSDTTNDEIGDLGRAVNSMAAGLELLMAPMDELQEVTAERELARQTAAERAAELRERIKELRCLLRVAGLLSDTEQSIEDACLGMLSVVRPAMRHPAEARITLDDVSYATANFMPSENMLTTRIQTEDVGNATIDVVYSGEHALREEDSFPVEERDLIDALGLELGKFIDRKHAVEALKKSEASFRDYFDLGLIGMAVTAPDKRWVRVNSRMVRMLGYSSQELSHMTWLDVTHPDDIGSDIQQFERLLEGKLENYTIEKRYLRKNGEIINVRLFVRAVHDDEGRLAEIITHVEDITEQKRLQAETLSLARFPRENPTPVMRLDFDGYLLYANSAATALAQTWGIELGDRLPDGVRRILVGSARGMAACTLDMTVGNRIYAFSLAPFPESGYLNAYGRDVTSERQAAAQIEALNEELERRVEQRTQELAAANKELEAFAYSVSHDLRAPLRSMDGFSLALIEDYGDQFDDTGRDYLRRVRAASQRMALLIDDLLTLSRVTRREIEHEDVDLSELARGCLEELRLGEPNRNVDVTIAEGLREWGDAQLLRLVLQNLLGNAWKFTSNKDEARIEFGAEQENGTTVYRVSDNGAGFDMRYADKLFGAFQRLHGADEFGGSGIGLATVQRIIHRHGGRVWAEGAVGQGATFRFTVGEFDNDEGEN